VREPKPSNRRRRELKIRGGMVDYLHHLVARHPGAYLEDIQKGFEENYGKGYSFRAMVHALNHLG
jgi:hypothetical protein